MRLDPEGRSLRLPYLHRRLLRRLPGQVIRGELSGQALQDEGQRQSGAAGAPDLGLDRTKGRQHQGTHGQTVPQGADTHV